MPASVNRVEKTKKTSGPPNPSGPPSPSGAAATATMHCGRRHCVHPPARVRASVHAHGRRRERERIANPNIEKEFKQKHAEIEKVDKRKRLYGIEMFAP